MMSLIIGLGVVLVLAILYMIFRIGRLVGLVKSPEDKADYSGNNVHAYLMIIFLVVSLGAFFWYSFAHFDSYVLPVASEHGTITDGLFWITMWITIISFTIIFVGLFWFTFKYRYRPDRKATFIPDNHALEIVWTIVPAIVLALLIFRGLSVWNEITAPASEQAEVIELVAQQFAWTVRYPGIKDQQLGETNFKMIDAVNEFGLNLEDKNAFDDFKALELHMPKGKEVLLKIRAKDVLHSVFLPHFRVKMDAVPGMQTHFKLVPTKTTAEMRAETGNPNFNYELACTEICGQGHFSMRLLVVVDEPEDYNKWKSDQIPWLKQNPEYLKQVPANLREAAMIKAGLPVEDYVEGQVSAQSVTISN
ncbi:MAG: cytochrome c oxidase subunit II [Cyclobacteriaceae bacterium]